MKGKTLLQTVDLSKKEKGVQPILIKDDPNHTLLSVYEDLKNFFSGNIKLAIPKKEEGKSWKDTDKIKYFSPVAGDISEVTEFEYEQQIKPALDRVKSQLEDPDLDPSDPDEREKLYLVEAFKFPESDLHTYLVKVGSHYILCNWGLENAPEISGIDFSSESRKTVEVEIKLGNKSLPYVFKADVSDSQIERCDWDIDGQKLKGEEISRTDIDLESLSESFHVKVDVKTKDNQRANNTRYTFKSEIQDTKEPEQVSSGFGSENGNFTSADLGNDDITSSEDNLDSEQNIKEEQEENEILAWLSQNWKRILIGLLIFLFLLWLISQCNTGSVNTYKEGGVSSDPGTESVSPGLNNSDQNNSNNTRDGGASPGSPGGKREGGDSGGSGEGSGSSEEPLLRDKDSQTKSKQKQLAPGIKAKPMEEVGTIYRMEYEDGYLYWLEVDGERHLLKFVPFNESGGSLNQGANSNQNEAI